MFPDAGRNTDAKNEDIERHIDDKHFPNFGIPVFPKTKKCSINI